MPLPLQLVAENEPHWRRVVAFNWRGRALTVGIECAHHDWRRLSIRHFRFFVRAVRWRSGEEVAQWEQKRA